MRSERKISETAGGFGGDLGPPYWFGNSVAALGDLDGDGNEDLAVGAPFNNKGVESAVWIVFLNSDGTVASEQKISKTAHRFGTSVAALGDLDGDGIGDLAVGAILDDDGGTDQGAVWILFLNADGTVASEQKISETAGGFGGSLDASDWFGTSVAAIGDLDGDGIVDLAVGAAGDNDGGVEKGAVWILFLNSDGTVRSEQKISQTAGGFGGLLEEGGWFGYSVAGLGDLDGDGIEDLSVGAELDDAGGANQGGVWILFLNADGTVATEQKISETEGGFGGVLEEGDLLGASVAALGDLDGDGIVDLAVGASQDDDGGTNQGGVWILFLNADGTVASEQKISETEGGFGGTLDPFDILGASVAPLGDLDGDGIVDLAVGAIGDDDGAANQGAVWILFLEGAPPCFTLDFTTEDDLVTPLVNGQHIDSEFGAIVTLTSTGQNAGLAVFDSTVGGPNDPSQDLDLLVGSGNLLILQTENFPPDGNDVFPRPNDDDNGGTITFSFQIAVELASMRLIDVDAGDQTSFVVLTDGAGRQRFYTVPSNWTGDRTLGQPGQGTLDLTTLAPQPGFGSVALASEAAGFAPADVVRLDYYLNGSGGLDDLGFCTANLPRATASVRNGTGVNPGNLGCASRPVLGTTWRADLDCRACGPGLAILDIRGAASEGPLTPAGEILVGGALLQRTIVPSSALTTGFTWDLPLDMSLCGLTVHVQGLCRASQTSRTGPFGPKTRQARSQLSNALDLELGF